MYSQRLLDHFERPRNAGELPPPAVTVEVSNPACGDILRLAARFSGGTVAEARYQARGCTATVAAGSALAEWLPGRSAAELARLHVSDIEQALDGLPPASRHAAALAVDAVKALLKAARL